MPDLPSVEQKFIADMLGYIAALDAGIAKAEEFAAANKRAEEAVIALSQTAADAAAVVSAAMGAMTGSVKGLQDALAGATLQAEALKAALRDMGGLKLQGVLGAGGGGRGGLRLFGGWLGGIRLTGNAIHWLISGFVELMAVVIPATVAAGAWAAVWLQGATNVAHHLQAVYTATEATAQMFHMTAGQAVGLGNALQTAQNAANPNVYQALGSAILVVNEHFGGLAHTGLVVGRVFDTFMAKVVQDFSKTGSLGKSVDSILSHMVGDLTGLGQVFGNLGHAVLSFASQMPMLAEFLLAVLAGFTRLAAVVIDVAGKFQIFGFSILTVLVAFEEFNRWGGLLVGILGRMGIATVALEGKFFSFARAASILKAFFSIIPALIGNVGIALSMLSARLDGAGAAMLAFSVRMQAAIAGMSTAMVLGGAAVAAGVGFLLYKLFTAQTGVQRFAASLQEVADKATNLQVLGVLASNMGKLSAYSAGLAANLGSVTTQMHANAAAGRYLVGLQGDLRNETGQANTAIAQQAQQFMTVTSHALDLAQTYHTSFTGALVLADMAGVKLNQTLDRQAWAIAQIKVQSLIAGYKAMGQPIGAVGADMTALAIQSGLAASQVSKLNSAWDQFMSNITGGTSGLAAFNQSLQNLSTGANTVTNVLGKAGSVTLSIKDFAQSLTTFSGKGAQAWQNFNQVVGSTAPQLIDWLRTAGAEGAISGKQFQQGILDMLSSLTPLASKSKTAQAELLALAQQAGLNIHTFPQLEAAIKNSGASAKDLAKIVSETTAKMGNMASVAQNLGTVMNSLVTTAMAQAALSTEHFDQKVGALDAAIRKYGADSPQAAAAAARVAAAQAKANGIVQAGIKLTGQFEGAMGAAAKSAELETANVDRLRAAIAALRDRTITINVDIAQHGGITLPGGGGTRITVPGMASGTDSARRGPAIVGEEGPELIMMRGGEQVVPAAHTAALMHLAGKMHGIPGYAGGTGSAKQLEQQLARELAVLVQRLLGSSSISGMSQFTGNLLATLKQLTADHHLGKAEDSRLTRLIRDDNKKLDTLFHERQKILNRIKAADAYAKNVSQAARSSASLSTIMSGAGGGPVSSAFLLASMKIDLAGIRKFDSDIKKLEKLGLDKALLNQIIQMGPVQGDQMAQALINGPLSNIRALNATESQVQKASKGLGRTAAEGMYGSGKDAGKGFLAGLKSQEREIDKMMKHLAQSMVGTIRHELGLKDGHHGGQHHVSATSPMHLVGAHMADGLGAGLVSRLPHLDVSLRGAAGHVSSALGSAAGAGGGGITINVTIPVETKLDGKVLYQSTQTQALRVNRRNPSNHLTLTRGRG